jgi:hypothetical protein
MTRDTDCCKAGEVAAKYGFGQKLADELGTQWEDEDGPGLRKIAKEFNHLVIDHALLDSGEPSLEGEARLLYRLLTDDSVTDAERARAHNRLESYGLDVDGVRDDFISYRTVDRHFQNCTDRERDLSTDPVTADAALDRVNALKRRLERVTQKSISQVDRHANLGTDDTSIDTFVDVNVACTDCGERMSLHSLFEGGCGCVESAPDTVLVDSPADGKGHTGPETLSEGSSGGHDGDRDADVHGEGTTGEAKN